MAKIRVTTFFTGVRDGEHLPRAFLPGCCYELADDGGDPPQAAPGSLLAVVLAEKWGDVTAKGTPVEPDLAREMSPQSQRAAAEFAANAAAMAEIEAKEQAEADVATAATATAEAEARAAQEIEADAAKRAAAAKAAAEAERKKAAAGAA